MRRLGLATLCLVAACHEDVTQPGSLLASLVAEIPIPANYGIHDTYVRDGLAFVSAWNSGLIIYDVGNGVAGGTPEVPRLVVTIPVDDRGVPGGPQVHNAWWFHNPVSGERRYVFVGQEGPGVIGGTTHGDIHVIDIANLAAPAEVAWFRLPGAGAHNFWMDEGRQTLYAAYYNGGVVALDVSGTLAGDLGARMRHRVLPGGTSYMWGVMQHQGSLYATDMFSGLWQLRPDSLLILGGGANVTARFSSDLWLHGSHAYTGTWGQRAAAGNAVNIWELDATGAPQLVDSIVTQGIGIVSDIEVSPDGTLLMFSSENGPRGGLHFYRLRNPARPTFARDYVVAGGIHTATFGVIGGRLYLFAARNPPEPALLILDVTDL